MTFTFARDRAPTAPVDEVVRSSTDRGERNSDMAIERAGGASTGPGGRNPGNSRPAIRDLLKRISPAQILVPAGFFLLIIGGWELAVHVFAVEQYILPSPTAIAASFAGEWGMLLEHTLVTAKEAALGFLIGNGVALLLAAVMAESRLLERGLYPYVLALRSLPIVAVAPLLVIWLGFNIWPIVFAAALVCFFPTLVNAIEGLRATDQNTMELMRGLNASRWQVFWRIKVFNALPYVMAALKIAVTSALVGAVVGEWIGADAGLGYLTILANNYVDTLLLFRAIVMIGLLGTVWFLLISLLQSRLLRWQRVQDN
jgi:NitT/TauT family transport system permease protein